MNKKKLKIIIPLWTFSKSGGCRVLSRLASKFKEYGHTVTIICYAKTIEPYYPLDCQIIFVDSNGKKTHRKTDWKINNKVQTIIDISIRHRALEKGINQYCGDYDIVLANQAETAFVVKKCKIPNKYYYIQAYEAWESTGKSNYYRRLFNYFIRQTYKLPLIRIVNADIYKDYKEIKSDYVVPPGLDFSIYYKKNVLWDGKRPLVVGCIGRKERWKGSQDVADAITMLKKSNNNIIFKVAFNPVNCEDYILEYPDGDKKLSDFYRSLDVLVAPATLQLGAIHYPVIEAMACGVSVITTGYYPANSDNSYIVPISSPADIAKAIEDIQKNYQKSLIKMERAYKEIQRFSWEDVSKKMLTIFYKTMKG